MNLLRRLRLFLEGGKKESRQCADNATEEQVPLVLEDSHGVKFILNPWDRPYRNNLVKRACDDDVFAVYSRVLRPGDIVFDVGAHIGRYSVFASRRVGGSGRVFAFEPVKENYWMLRTTIALNQCDNIVAVNTALGNFVGVRTMNLFEKGFSSWSTFGRPQMTTPDGRALAPTRKEEVALTTLDRFCEENSIDWIDLLKVDVEGFEVDVFKGSERMLEAKAIDLICFEVSQQPLQAAGASVRDLFEILGKNGYAIYEYHPGEGRFEKLKDPDLPFHANFYASAGAL